MANPNGELARFLAHRSHSALHRFILILTPGPPLSAHLVFLELDAMRSSIFFAIPYLDQFKLP